ncbi:RNA polymerase sigma factor [Jeotgalibacillus sp. ET6]|uniref:RNA polymerase sigma factor n=1 Tax=Jeotgalibacillus sp. ET6 TaxID=3037260 RepID=UPI0024182D32|nr:RNA polymerase sigma factor [Jeotgalibacillus sp. ET6]MDG5472030.1 RNA polymerase sigma factor [Jeotgalibacillus sp. ET6]
MIAYQQGDMESLDQLYLLLKGPIYSFVYRYSRDEQLSIDIVQDTFIKLQRSKHLYKREKGKISSYLYQIAYRLMIDKLNRRKKWRSFLPFLTPSDKEEVDLADRMSVREAVAALSEVHRPIVLLFYYHDLTHEEIASVLDIPKGTVKSRLHYAIKKLKEELGGEENVSRSL